MRKLTLAALTTVTITTTGALCACGTPQSSFGFYIDGADYAHRHVTSSNAAGEVDNAGFVALDSGAWSLTMSLGGLAVGPHDGVDATLLDENNGAVFTTSQGGSCHVELAPHGANNGDDVRATVFYCSGLASSSGATVDVTGGQFVTYLSDSANNPNPPSPPGP